MLLLLEHVNLGVNDEILARKFFVDGLGCKLNTIGTNYRQVHVNLGLCQFHLPFKTRNPHDVKMASQIINGWIELSTEEELENIRLRLVDIFKNSVEASVENHELVVRGPFGNVFKIHTIHKVEAEAIRQLGGHSGGSDRMLGIKGVRIFCPTGTCQIISKFYETTFRASTEIQGGTCSVLFEGPCKQSLTFEEVDGVVSDNYDMDYIHQYHVACYVDSREAFLSSFAMTQKNGCLFVNPRFQGGPVEFASSETENEARACWQFRIKDIKNPMQEQQVVYQLEHEVRSTDHVSFPIHSFESKEI